MYVYLLTNSLTGDFYVGKTVKNIEYRFSSHLYAAKSGTPTHLYRAIRFYGEENFKISLLEEIQGDLEDLNEREKFWIAELTPLYNMTKGGDGGDTSSSELYKASRVQHSLDMRGEKNPFYGRTHSEETKKKISSKKIGYKMSKETKEKISKFNKGKKLSQDSINKRSLSKSKIWFLICPDGNEIKIQNLAAFCKEKNLDQRNMSGMYRGVYKTSKGYRRNYELDPKIDREEDNAEHVER